jgi:hypothetical protein
MLGGRGAHLPGGEKQHHMSSASPFFSKTIHTLTAAHRFIHSPLLFLVLSSNHLDRGTRAKESSYHGPAVVVRTKNAAEGEKKAKILEMDGGSRVTSC